MAQNKRIAPFFNADGTVKEFTAQDSTAQNTGDYAVQNKNLATVGARYSIKNVDGKDIVSVDTDQDIFEGVDRSEYGKVARDYIKEHFRGKTVGDISFTRNTEREYTQSKYSQQLYRQTSSIYPTKMKAATELDNFVKTGDLIAHEETKHPHSYNEGGYDRYAVEFELGNKTFTGEMLIALGNNGKSMFYDIVNIKEGARLLNRSKPETSATTPSSTSSIRYKTEKVNSFEEKSFEKDSQTVGKVNENAYSSSLKGRESEFLYAPVSAETMPTETAKKVMNTLTKLTNGRVNVVLTSEKMTTADGQTASGVFANGILYLSANATAYDQAMIVGSHELIHTLEGTKEYHALGDFITETITGDPELQKKYDVNRYVAAYANVQSENYSVETKQYEALTEMYADFIANEILTNENTVQRLVNRNRNVVVRMVDWVRSAVKRLGMTKDDRAAYDAMRKWEKLLSSALNAGKGGITLDEVEERVQVNKQAETQEKTAERSSTGKLAMVRYSLEEGFSEQVDKVINGTFDKENSHIKVLSHTPSIYIEKADMRDLPILMSYEKLCISLFDDGNLSNHYHDLGVDTIKQIPIALENPLYILSGSNNKRVEAILTLKDKKGRDIFTVIEFDSPGRLNGKFIEANILVTAFGAKTKYIQNKLESRELLYEAKNSLSQVNPRGQFPSVINENEFSTSIIRENSEKSTENGKKGEKRFSIDVNSPKTDFNDVLRQYLHRIDLTKDIKQALAEKYGKETARRIVNIWDNTSGQIGVDMSTVTKEIADKGVYIDAYYPEEVLFEMDKEMRGYTDLALTDYDFDNQIRRVTETQEKRPIKQRIQDVKAGTKEEWVDLQIQTTNVQAGIV